MQNIRNKFLKGKLYLDIFQILRKLTKSVILSLSNITALLLNIIRSSYNLINKLFKYKQNSPTNTDESCEEKNNFIKFLKKLFIALIIISGIVATSFNNYIVAYKTLSAAKIKNMIYLLAVYVASIALYEVLININIYLRNNSNKIWLIQFSCVLGLIAAAVLIIPKWIIMKTALEGLLFKYIPNVTLIDTLLYIFLVINTFSIIWNSVYDFYPEKSQKRKNAVASNTSKSKTRFLNFFLYLFVGICALINATGVFLFEFQSLKLVFEPKQFGLQLLIIFLAGCSAIAVIFNWIDLFLYAKCKTSICKNENTQTKNTKMENLQKINIQVPSVSLALNGDNGPGGNQQPTPFNGQTKPYTPK